VQITGRYVGLVRFDAPAPEDRYAATHYDRATGSFSGPMETLRLPPVEKDHEGRPTSSSDALQESPLNADGWFVYGAPDAQGTFVVQALAPRALLRVAPHGEVDGKKKAQRFIRKDAWADARARKGTAASTYLSNRDGAATADEIAWAEGDSSLLAHVYGGIGGRAREKMATTPIYFGHFAYGIAEVVREPLDGELRFEVTYYQVYTHNEDGLIAGSLHWSRYMGDRQFGWLGLRPTCDTLLASDAFTQDFTVDGAQTRSALDAFRAQLEAMTARYRIGDGSGGTYVGPANNCAQDSNRALFATLRDLAAAHPEEREPFEELALLTRDLSGKLQPFGTPRRDWTDNVYDLGTTMRDNPLQAIKAGLGSWRVMLPRVASNTIAGTFLAHDAEGWVLFCDQVGGRRDDIEPVVPTSF
jgi:predicted Abi (CAAX) family protease